MNKRILGNPVPRPLEDFRDLLKPGPELEGGPMAPDIETVLRPREGRTPKRPIPGPERRGKV